jgi:hypothetical protein
MAMNRRAIPPPFLIAVPVKPVIIQPIHQGRNPPARINE